MATRECRAALGFRLLQRWHRLGSLAADQLRLCFPQRGFAPVQGIDRRPYGLDASAGDLRRDNGLSRLLKTRHHALYPALQLIPRRGRGWFWLRRKVL